MTKTPSPTPSPAPDRARAARRTVIACAAAVVGMVGLSYAAVPLYRIFCQATGFAGTPLVATQASKTTGERVFTVRFDSNVAPGLGWRFEPEQPTIDVKVGETTTIFYKITNTSAQPVTALASFNVAPELTGAYFNKLQCFCFNEIVLKAGETLEAPVVFYIDPAISKDRDLATTREITLSYTIFPAKGSAKPVAENTDPTRKPKL